MSTSAATATTTTVTVTARHMTVIVNGRVLKTYTMAECGRDLGDICGAFHVEYLDEWRSASLLGDPLPEWVGIKENDPVEIRIHGETVLKGWVDDLQLETEGGQMRATISGRDKTGDLVDASANPTGPGEYRLIHLVDVIGNLTGPFGIAVSADVNTGDPFTLVAVEAAEPAMSTIEKLSRQRGVLVTSDGIGGLVLTQAGTTRAPGSLLLPGNVNGIQARISARGRFSDVWVKGQFRSLLRPSGSTLSADAQPLSAMPEDDATVPSATETEAAAMIRYGHSVDPSVGRYRPRVWLAATQSGGSVATQTTANPTLDSAASGLTADPGPAPAAYHGTTRRPRRKATTPRTDGSPWGLQDQADWRMRSTRAQATARVYSVLGYRGDDGGLWKPNALVYVRDQYTGIDRDMLIGAVTYVDAPDGEVTRISVVERDSYDLTGDMDHGHNGARRSGHVVAHDGMAGGQ